MSTNVAGAKKKIFVIMPFVEANGRTQADLTTFFNDYIRQPIEESKILHDEYEVVRSGNSFLILDRIIEDLARADVVICDLSGSHANPNVMFELGVRLSVSARPTILIREEHPDNKRIFDVSGLYTEPYLLTATRKLETFLVNKIAEYERLDSFESPVLKILNQNSAFWMQLPIRKASAFLGGIASAAEAALRTLTRALGAHLREKNQFLLGADSDLIYQKISECCSVDDLSEFDYHITSIPSLDSYLSSVYLLGLVEDDIEKCFRSYAMAYALNFNVRNSALFFSTRHEEMLSYSYETLILMNLSRGLIQILGERPGSDARRERIEAFKENYSKSRII